MPTYEYACPKCGIIDFFQSIKDAPLAKCPQCKRCKVTRLFSGGAGVIFKGSGFWETDYNRSSDYQTKAKAESGGGGDSDPASKSKTQTATKKIDGGGAGSGGAGAAKAPAAPATAATPAGSATATTTKR
jgi:putative FmdB family regulatory protein